ncbi:sulfatase-like hydrolase/transferase [bacterium]|nr:sulfatase-like hydrolase/transferase [bacterium]
MFRFLVLIIPIFCTAVAAAAERPNLIFVLTDDQRYDTLGCTGNGFIQTPHLDQLAADGTLFTNGSVTSAICTPSRVCYFLGQYERKHGVNFNSGTAVSREAWEQSYPVVLREQGYFTGYVGKNHVPIGTAGYDSGLMEQSFDMWYAAHGHLQFYPKQRHEIFRQAEADTQTEIIREGVGSFLKADGSFIDGATAFLENRPADQPFCLSIACNLPHGSSTGTMKLRPEDPELYRETYRDRLDRLPLPISYVAKADIQTPKLPADVLYAEFRQFGYDYVDTPDGMKERMIRKYQTITGIDRMIGEIRELLKQQGIAEKTVIVFTSDHGIMNGEFGLGGKALNYETCLRVPMIVMDPRVPETARGQRSLALAQSIDIAPTLLDLAGATKPASMQGKSLKPIVDGQADNLRRYSFAENLWSTYFGNPRIESVRDQKWKYIRYFANDRERFSDVTKKNQYTVSEQQANDYAESLTASIRGEQPVYEELFFLASDPGETTNLAHRPAYAKELTRLREACQQLVTEAKGDVNTSPAVNRLPDLRK